MLTDPEAAVDRQSLVGAAMVGSSLALALAAAYALGGQARDRVVREELRHLAATPQAIAAGAPSPATDRGALALVDRRAPADIETRPVVERGARLAMRLANLRRYAHGAPEGQVIRVSLPPPAYPAAPFVLRGALAQSRDLQCLTQAVYYEARGESPAGQAAVAQVVLNRTRHPAFPHSICGVVFQRLQGGCQFSFACDGSMGRTIDPAAWDRARRIASHALDGEVMDAVGDATHFHVSHTASGWTAGLLKVAQIGAHAFYRFAGRGTALSQEPQPSTGEAGRPLLASLMITPNLSAAAVVAEPSRVIANAAAAVQSVATAMVKGAVDKPAPAEGAPPAAAKAADPAEAKPAAPAPSTPIATAAAPA